MARLSRPSRSDPALVPSLILGLGIVLVLVSPVYAASGGSGSLSGVCSASAVEWTSPTGEAIGSGVTVTGTLTVTGTNGGDAWLSDGVQSSGTTALAVGVNTVSVVATGARTWYLHVSTFGESDYELCDGGYVDWSGWSVTGDAAPTPTPTPAPTPTPTAPPSAEPSVAPSATPTAAPSAAPGPSFAVVELSPDDRDLLRLNAFTLGLGSFVSALLLAGVLVAAGLRR